jgi:hypothetical protein
VDRGVRVVFDRRGDFLLDKLLIVVAVKIISPIVNKRGIPVNNGPVETRVLGDL